MWNKFKTLDFWLYLLPILLASFGVALIYSITYSSQGSDLENKQKLFVIIGVLVMIIMTFIDYRALQGWSFWIYWLSIGLLIFLLLLPDNSSLLIKEFGARRWLGIAGFQFQPSELAKIATIIALSNLLARVHGIIRWRTLMIVGAIVLLPTIIVLQQPDLGTAIIILLASGSVLLSAGLKRKQWLILSIFFIIALAALILSYQKIPPFELLLKDYQRERIATFIDPDSDPKRQGYNILQSIIAVGSGGFFGQGLGFGSQSQLYFLPVAHSDFIFAALAESWGFIGSVGIIAIYFILLSRIINAINLAKDRFGMLFASGVFGMILFQVLINIGMNIRLFPVTGIPLPLISYGGTSLIGIFFSLGVVQSIVMRYKKINF